MFQQITINTVKEAVDYENVWINTISQKISDAVVLMDPYKLPIQFNSKMHELIGEKKDEVKAFIQ